MYFIKPPGAWIKEASHRKIAGPKGAGKAKKTALAPAKAGIYDLHMKRKEAHASPKRRCGGISAPRKKTGAQGFSMIELLTSLGIIGVLSSISYPMYVGYVDNTKIKVVQDKLRAAHMQEQEYFASYAAYYAVSASCDGDDAASINASLFGGQNVLGDSGTEYCLTQTATDNFLMKATYTAGSGDETQYTIDQNGTTNF